MKYLLVAGVIGSASLAYTAYSAGHDIHMAAWLAALAFAFALCLVIPTSTWNWTVRLLKLVALVLCAILCGLAAWYLYSQGNMQGTGIFAFVCCVALFFSFTHRKLA